jgi:hypothetical protein
VAIRIHRSRLIARTAQAQKPFRLTMIESHGSLEIALAVGVGAP